LIVVVLENDVNENLASTVVKVMKKCRGIRCFVLRKAFIGEEGVKMICKALTQLNYDPQKPRCVVSSLTLCSDPVDAGGASHLSHLLAQPHCSLQHLDLSQNVIGDEGCKLLANGLTSNCLLRVLDLSGNLLVDEGVVALADMLQSNCTLQSLDLSNNMFGDSPVLFLTDALKSNSTLQTLK
jgi:Ran GTPase-activating protein (RanGAP) involved in mRNA processing and transport